MKKLFSLLLFLTFTSYSQEFQGFVIYDIVAKSSESNYILENISDNEKEKIINELSKNLKKEIRLEFKNFESILYVENKVLTSTFTSKNKIWKTIGDPKKGTKLYKNIKDKTYLSQESDREEKSYLIQDSLPNFNWILMDEQKKIGAYTCYKAKSIQKATQEELDEYNKKRKEWEQKNISVLELKEPKDKIIEAWYTTEIPISNGPDKYFGLPGLILELHEKNTSYLCTKITLNPKDKVEIKKPKTGKKVSQAEFDKIEEDKLNEMKDENGVIQIKMN